MSQENKDENLRRSDLIYRLINYKCLTYLTSILALIAVLATAHVAVGRSETVAQISHTIQTKSSAEVAQPPTPQQIPLTETLSQAVQRLSLKYHQSETKIKNIIECEGKAYKNESWVNGHPNYDENGNIWSRDFGPLQINDYYHKERMVAEGLDITKWEDSLEYGFQLIKEQGFGPWTASQYCWDK